MKQDPNPTDYPHLEAFIDWIYEHVEELPASSAELIKRVQTQPRNNKRDHNSISLLRRWNKDQ